MRLLRPSQGRLLCSITEIECNEKQWQKKQKQKRYNQITEFKTFRSPP